MQLIIEGRQPIKDPDNKAIEDTLRSLLGNEDKDPGFAILDPERYGEGDGNCFMRVTGGPQTFVLEYRDGIEKREYRSKNENFSHETASSIFLAYNRGDKKSWLEGVYWLRLISPDELQEIVERHRRWVESEGKEGENDNLNEAYLQKAELIEANLQKARLWRANLQEAHLYGANLQEADLSGTEGLTAPQVKQARNWKLAFYDDDFLKELGLPPDHNETLPIKLAELE